MKKLKNSKGFTLMEMLIVVAIIAVLIAIAIPTFTNSWKRPVRPPTWPTCVALTPRLWLLL